MIGTTISHYHITAKLGAGGMGEVYRAEDTTLKRDVALKVLPPDLADSQELLERFQREAEALAALDHPNIVSIHTVEEAEGVRFLTMQLVEGKPLSELIPAGGLPLERFFSIAIPLADALAAAHQKGVIHRDLKPANLMVTDEGRVKVLDFGLAKLGGLETAEDLSQLATEGMTEEGRVLGTCAYMSPEQAQGQTVDPRSDIFSLGIVLYEMATGSRPFHGDNQLSILTAIMRDTPDPISGSSPALPPALSEIVARCLRKDPAERYADASGLKEDLGRLQAEVVSGITSASGVSVAPARGVGTRRLVWSGVAVVVAILAGAFLTWIARRNARIEWARTEAIPRIQELQQQSSWLDSGTRTWEAHELAAQAARSLGDDPILEAAWESVTRDITIHSQPPGADLWAKPYVDPNGEWRYVGRTPLDAVRFPAGGSRVKLELPGHRTVYDLLFNAWTTDKWDYQLRSEGSIPEEMVAVPADDPPLLLPGIDHLPVQSTRDFLMDRFETTNREYKNFVDDGGYESAEHWPTPMIREGRELSWEEAKGFFTDSTGRPGPATWEVGDFQEGRDDYPVSGISWYEAAAYADWAGKSLPTVYHWNQVAFTWASGEIIPLSNLGGDGPAPVDSLDAMHRFGVSGLAGNVREWVFNAISNDDQRFILGGGWNDEPYSFNDAYAQSPWDRSPSNGFRCMRYLSVEDETAELTHVIDVPTRDFYAETQVSDETFAIWLKQYDYDPTPLEATIEAREEFEEWKRETIHFDAAYGDERMMAHLFLPRAGPSPFPTIVHFPGSNAIHSESSADLDGHRFGFLLKSGYAVMIPIYKGTYERGDDLTSDYADETNFYKDHVIMWSKDLSRSIDYLETRDDLDLEQLAFYGVSWGGAMGAILPAIEKRIKLNVLYVAGLMFQRALPEVDQFHYVSRVTVPTVMINGEFDFFFPVETSQKPFYDLLGTPVEHKRYVVYPGSHAVPRRELIKEVLAWLDRYSKPS